MHLWKFLGLALIFQILCGVEAVWLEIKGGETRPRDSKVLEDSEDQECGTMGVGSGCWLRRERTIKPGGSGGPWMVLVLGEPQA